MFLSLFIILIDYFSPQLQLVESQGTSNKLMLNLEGEYLNFSSKSHEIVRIRSGWNFISNDMVLGPRQDCVATPGRQLSWAPQAPGIELMEPKRLETLA